MRISYWIKFYIKPNIEKINQFRIGLISSFSNNFTNNENIFEDLSIRDLNYLIMGIDKIKLEDFYDWVKINSDEDDSEYILKFLNYVKESSKKSDTYLNTLWQTISGSRNLSAQGFPNEGSVNFVDNVDYGINTTTCSYNIYFNKVIFDDSINLDDHLSEEKLKQYNKGKTSKGVDQLII